MMEEGSRLSGFFKNDFSSPYQTLSIFHSFSLLPVQPWVAQAFLAIDST